MDFSGLKTILIVFFDIKIEYRHKKDEYKSALLFTYHDNTEIKGKKKLPELWVKDFWISYQDNVPVHNALGIRKQCLPKN